VQEVVEGTVGFQNYNFGIPWPTRTCWRCTAPACHPGHLPIGEECHKAGEWVDVESVRQLVEVYRSLALRFPDYR